MSLPSEILPVGLLGTGAAGAAGYQIERSLRFNSADSAYLSRTPASAGNRKTWTWAGWVKKVNVSPSDESCLFGDTNESYDCFRFRTTDAFEIFWYDGANKRKATTAVFRDASAWYHIVVKSNTTQASEPDRVKLYINGIEQTAFATNDSISQDYEWRFNNNTAISIGRRGTSGTAADYLDGYLADIHFIDGQALDPTSFGEFDDNGIWQPFAYAGEYGTNGFHLDFADNSSAAALGYDAAGSNDWTVNNLSVTAGAGNDSLVDSPTNNGEDTGAGGEVRGNYCTWNPLDNQGLTLANGNLDVSFGTSTWYNVKSTIGVSASKWYYEYTVNSGSTYQIIGLFATTVAFPPAGGFGYMTFSASGWGYQVDGNKSNNNSFTATGITAAAGDVIMVAYDMDAAKLWFGKNGTWMNSGNPATGANAAFSNLSGTLAPAVSFYGSQSGSLNFGQRPFAYTAPSGFKALCTQNLPAPIIEDGSTAMDVVTYTGTGAALTPTSSLNFSPDLIWIKSRSATTDHSLYDTVRGAQTRLEPNQQPGDVTSDNGVTAFNSNGFTLGTLAQVNTSSATYVGWCWDAGSSNVTNTDGSMTSTVRANTSTGVSIIDFSATNGTVGHGLGVAPDFFVYKTRTQDSNWSVYHKSLGNTQRLLLNLTDAAATSSTYWNNTSPTSTVITLGSNFSGIGSSIIYAFAPVSGFSAFGKYTGNGSADGPFVFTNHRPRWILIKRTDTTGNWTIIDTSREGYNVDNDPLYPNLSNAEGTTDLADILSNGFKLRTTDASVNANTGTYIYASLAENPFNISRAR